MSTMPLISPVDDSVEKFQQKLIEILGKGFKDKQSHNFLSDIELSRRAYKISESTDVVYMVMKAVLSLPSLVNAEFFLNTLKEVLTFYQNVLRGQVICYGSCMECLKAIEYCTVHSHHMQGREATAYIIHFLYQAKVFEAQYVLDFFDQLEQAENPLMELDSMKMLTSWLQHEITKDNYTEQTVCSPLTYWLNRSTVVYPHMKPMYVWVRGEGDQPYNPLYLWVRKTDESANEQPNNDNENNGQNQDDRQFEGEQFEINDEDLPSDIDEQLQQELRKQHEIHLDDLPVKYLTKNFLRGYPACS